MATLDAAGAAAGAWRWLETVAWRLLGQWAPLAAPSHPTLAVLLDTHAQHAAWRAEQWWERLPVLAGVERTALCVAPSPAWVGAADVLEGTTGPAGAGGLACAAVAYRVLLPRLAATYAAGRAGLVPVADGSALRTLAMAEADLLTDWRQGEAALQVALDGAPEALWTGSLDARRAAERLFARPG